MATDALSVLSADHQQIYELANFLTGAAGDPRGSRSERQHVAKQLILEVSRHEVVEEMFLWPLVRERLPGGDALSEAALQQEGGAKRLLHEMDHMSTGNEDFMTLAFHVQSHLRDHITYEQNQVWPKIQLHVPREDLERLGRRITVAKRTAPTRPHPHIPADPRALATFGALAAIVDRARDAVTRRGKPRVPADVQASPEDKRWVPPGARAG